MITMSGVQLKDGRIAKDLLLTFGLTEAIDQFTMANGVHWYGLELRRDDDHLL